MCEHQVTMIAEDKGCHLRTHNLVHCTEKEDKENRTSTERLVDLEAQLSAIRNQMDRIEENMNFSRAIGYGYSV